MALAPNAASRVRARYTHFEMANHLTHETGLCPDGQLSGTKGSRYVLASAEESWHRIQALCVRVQDLEFALERSHSLVVPDKHPLLNAELLKIGQDPRAVKPEANASTSKATEEVPISNFGTMKISKAGSYRWLGVSIYPLAVASGCDLRCCSDNGSACDDARCVSGLFEPCLRTHQLGFRTASRKMT